MVFFSWWKYHLQYFYLVVPFPKHPSKWLKCHSAPAELVLRQALSPSSLSLNWLDEKSVALDRPHRTRLNDSRNQEEAFSPVIQGQLLIGFTWNCQLEKTLEFTPIIFTRIGQSSRLPFLHFFYTWYLKNIFFPFLLEGKHIMFHVF